MDIIQLGIIVVNAEPEIPEFLLLETGDKLLLESGDGMLLE